MSVVDQADDTNADAEYTSSKSGRTGHKASSRRGKGSDAAHHPGGENEWRRTDGLISLVNWTTRSEGLTMPYQRIGRRTEVLHQVRRHSLNQVLGVAESIGERLEPVVEVRSGVEDEIDIWVRAKNLALIDVEVGAAMGERYTVKGVKSGSP